MAAFEAVSSSLQMFDPPPAGDILWYKAHGFLMWLSFSVLFPLGVMGVRYSRICKKLEYWFQYHWLLQSTGVLLSTVGLSIALRRFENCKDTTHGTIGVALAFIVLIQPVFAVFRPALGAQLRPFWAFSHWFLGTVTVVLGWVNIFQGLDLYFVDWPGSGPQTLLFWVFSAQVSLLVFCYLVMVRCPDSDCEYDKTKLSKPLLEKHQFMAKV